MAISVRNLAFSWSESPLAAYPACQLLFLRWTQEIEMPQTPMHSHPFWQMELITQGRVRVKGNGRTFQVSRGDALLMPPRVQHQFFYDYPDVKFFAFSFAVEGKLDVHALKLVTHCPFLERVERVMESLLQDTRFPNQDLRAAIAAQLASVLSYVYAPVSTERQDHLAPLVQRALAYVRERNGGNVTVREIAEHLGYTANYTSTQFHLMTGESLKNFLDRQRAEKAKDLLRYTALSVKQIARQLEFNDIFSFSRHFRRVSGMSPRRFRHREQQQ